MRRKIVIGNWKMNADQAFTRELLTAFTNEWFGVHRAEVVVCPPFPYLSVASELLQYTNIGIGSQDVSEQGNGAFTGQISAEMLLDCGCSYTLVGHSERREYQQESSELVALKFEKAVQSGLIPVLCIGENREQREQGKTFDVIGSQLLKVIDRCGLSAMTKSIIAYEPLWAIGTGVTATPQVAQEVHAYIREILGPEGEHIRILYGGSVNPSTAEGLFSQPDIDGALVGGASLNAHDFVEVCRAAE